SPGIYVLSIRTVKNSYQHKFFFAGSYGTGSAKQSASKNMLQKSAAGVDSLTFTLHGKVCLKVELSAYEDSLEDIILDTSSIYETFTDERDGGIYKKVTIGTQTWMAENLNYKVQEGNSWCYGDDSTNCETYGRLYDLETISMDGHGNGSDICPPRWRLPTKAEWEKLVTAAGESETAAGALKSVADWDYDGSSDTFGFNWLPGGLRQASGGYSSVGRRSYIWIGEGAAYYVLKDKKQINQINDVDGRSGHSVRCIEDTSNYIPILKDERDGKIYKVVKLDDQWWLGENLNYKPDSGQNACYANQETNCDVYGMLYNYRTATADYHGNGKDVCPVGWRLPTLQEYKDLIAWAGGDDAACEKLKTFDGWINDHSGTDDYGFSLLPAGMFNATNGVFSELTGRAYLIADNGDVTPGAQVGGPYWLTYSRSMFWYMGGFQPYYMSVRCLKE
ncbi:MAG: hypothetical protein HQK83_19570, partial [Fibrobacteria bacterium]|nr:hypothetical protein [Fibrobacteria bacterium]